MSSSKSQTQANQTTNQTDNRIAADAGAIVAGAGSMVQIENLSDDVAVAAIESGEYTVEKGFGFAGDALSTVTEASKDQLGSVLGFASDFLRQQTDATAQQRDAYDAQARRSTELIAAQAGVVAPANTDKQTLLLFGLAAGLGAIVLLKK